MSDDILGIHHVTAIARDAQANLDFYAGLLGMRLVKRTVNFDDPNTYHFYFGDEHGRPGTLLTFFPIARAYQGEPGTGQVTVTGLSVSEISLTFWRERLQSHGVHVDDPVRRFDEQVLTFFDPDGLQLELVATQQPGPGQPWPGGPVPPEFAIHGVHHVRLREAAIEPTLPLLGDLMGFRLLATENNLSRYVIGAGGPGATVDIETAPEARGRVAAGSVHHVAFRLPNDTAQGRWRERLAALGYNVTPVQDRNYFRSIYFREPGGVLFEFATDGPGFLIDENEALLGRELRLPPWLEARREDVASRLPPVIIPE
ncbi:MAG: ring-cleaving dioxygenase [Chloroflexota bacterium]